MTDGKRVTGPPAYYWECSDSDDDSSRNGALGVNAESKKLCGHQAVDSEGRSRSNSLNALDAIVQQSTSRRGSNSNTGVSGPSSSSNMGAAQDSDSGSDDNDTNSQGTILVGSQEKKKLRALKASLQELSQPSSSTKTSAGKGKRKATSIEILALDESETVEDLRRQVKELKKQNTKKRKIEALDTHSDIPREDIIALQNLVRKEAEYLQALNSNKYVHFAIAISTRCDGGNVANGKLYMYVNPTYKQTIDRLFVVDKDSSWAVSASTRALQAMGNALKSFPGSRKDPLVRDMKDDFKEVYKDLATAVKRMKERLTYMDILKSLVRPDERGTLREVLDPGLITILEDLLMQLKNNSTEWSRSNCTIETLLNTDIQPFTVNAVAAMINHNRMSTKSLSRTTNDTRTAEWMVMMARDVLLQHPPSRSRQRTQLMIPRLIETETGVQIAPYR